MHRAKWIFWGMLGISMMLSAEWRVAVGVSGGVKFPDDSLYRQVYARYVFSPEARLQVRIWRGWYVWACYGYLKKNGRSQPLESVLRLRENLAAFGLGSEWKLGRSWRMDAAAGYAHIWYNEKGAMEGYDGQGKGWIAETGIRFLVGRRVALAWRGGYSKVLDRSEGITTGLGGIRSTLGILLLL